MVQQGKVDESNPKPPFSWNEFGMGRARFSGGVRGADQVGHETFALELDGTVQYGELRRSFLEDGNDFNIEIVSFGWPGKEWVGMPMPGMCRRYDKDQLAKAQALVIDLVAAGARAPEKPSVMVEYPDARYRGEVLFRNGWALQHEEVSP